jgi:hypothetical protein
MRTRCTINKLADVPEPDVRERLGRSIHLDGPITDLVIGQEYAVQALTERDGGLWLFLHTVAQSEFPYPYPAEMFETRDTTLPLGWCICLQKEHGKIKWKQISFPEWANDEHFYEKLVEGNRETVSVYQRRMIRP